MKPFNGKKILAACLALSIAAVAFGGCHLYTGRLKYMLKPEPVLAESADSLERKPTDSRQWAYNRYGYDSLSGSLQSAYDALDHSVSQSCSEPFSVYVSGEAAFNRVLEAYENDHPEVFWLDASSRYTYYDYGNRMDVTLSFVLEGEELENAKRKLADQVEKIAEGAPDNATDYEAELYLNGYITDNCEYQGEAAFRHSAYGALIGGGAVCDGYAKAFQLLCNRLGIECVGIEGYAAAFSEENGESSDTGHMWNCVKIGGGWYHIDVTWNDGEYHIQKYTYFNLTDDEIRKTHTITPLYAEGNAEEQDYLNVFVPRCDSEEYNYFRHDCVTITNLDDDSEIIAALIKAARNGERYVDFMIGDNLDYEETAAAIADGYGYAWLDAANYYNGDAFQISMQSDYYTYQNLHAVTFDLTYD